MALAGSLAHAGPVLADAKIVKGPYLTGLTSTSVTVRFELDAALRATLGVAAENVAGDVGPPRSVFESPASSDLRVVRVVGLRPATRYAYTVLVGHAVLGSGHFTSFATDDSRAPVTFLLYGDDRTDPAAHAAVVRAMADVPSDFLVNSGDLVADGSSTADWQSFFDVEAPMLRDRALFVAIGNHELYEDAAGGNFAKYFGFLGAPSSPSLYGTARVGSVRLFFLSGMHDWASGEEHDWLVRELDRADGEAGLKWRIAVTHHGPWSSGPHGPSANLVGAHIPELLAAHKVDLIVSGHDHLYERGDGGALKYIVSGGGGAPLYPIAGNNPASRKVESAYHFVEVTATSEALRITARRVDATVLDRCGFAKGAPWDCDTLRAPPAPEPLAAPAPAAPRCGCHITAPRGGGAWLPLAVALGLFVWARRAWRRRETPTTPRPEPGAARCGAHSLHLERWLLRSKGP